MCSKTIMRLGVWGSAAAFSVYLANAQATGVSDTAGALALPFVEQEKVAATVGEMLAIDTRIALKKEQQRELEAMGLKPAAMPSGPRAQLVQPDPIIKPADSSKDTEPVPAKPKAPVLSVEGIFGPGDQLGAYVIIDGRSLRYKAGQRYPIGYDRSFPYQLMSINVPCIQLSGPGGPHKLCVDGVQEK